MHALEVVGDAGGRRVDAVQQVVVGGGRTAPGPDVNGTGTGRDGGHLDHRPRHDQVGPIGVRELEYLGHRIARGERSSEPEAGPLRHLVAGDPGGLAGPGVLDLHLAG